MATPVMAGAIDALKRLSVVLDGRIWVVSKCGPRIPAADGAVARASPILRTERHRRYSHSFLPAATRESQPLR